MKKLFILSLFIGLINCCFSIRAANYYWIGGSGAWNNLNHWATTSGNTANSLHAVVPGANDDVFFDENSGFTINNRTVQAYVGSRQCRNFTVSGTGVKPEFMGDIQVAGNFNAATGTGLNAKLSFTPTTGVTSTIQSNGNFFNNVQLSGTGTVKLLEPFRVGEMKLQAGTFDSNGKEMEVNNLESVSQGSNTKTLRLHNSVIKVRNALRLNDWKLNIYAGTSHIIFSNLSINEHVVFEYREGTFHNITFENPVRISNSSGSLGTNFNNVVMHKGMVMNNYNTGLITGNNSFRSLTIHSGLFLMDTHPDTRITIRQNLTAVADPCGEWITLEGRLTMSHHALAVPMFVQPGATVNVSRAIIKGINKQGAIHTATQSINRGDNTGWNFTSPTSRTFYWIGGTGNWFDVQRWSNTSGGASVGCVPTPADNVVFDVNSSSGNTPFYVTINGQANCRNFTVTATSPQITVAVANADKDQLSIFGNAIWRPQVNTNSTLRIRFMTPPGQTNTLQSNGMLFNTQIITKEDGGILSVVDQLQHNAFDSDFRINGGTFTSNSHALHLKHKVTIAPLTTVNLGASNVYTEHFYIENGATLNAGTSHIYLSDQPGNLSTATLVADNQTFYNITALTHLEQLNARQGITANIVRLQQSANILSGTNTFAELHLTPGYTYVFTTNGTQRITGLFKSVANGCNGWINLQSRQSGTRANLNLTGANRQVAYNNIKDIAVTPATTATASINLGNNSGWTFTAPPSRNMYWIGGAGDWNDPHHWSFASGGTSAGCIPSAIDNVFFDAGSGFTDSSKIITINADAYCRNLTVAGSAIPPTIMSPTHLITVSLNVHGSITLQAGMSFSPQQVFLRSTSNTTIKSNGVIIAGHIIKAGTGTVRLQDSITSEKQIYIQSGTFLSQGHSITALSFGLSYFSLGSPTANTVNLGSSNVIVEGYYVNEATTLIAGTSHIRTNVIYTHDRNHTFYDVTFTGNGLTPTENNRNHTFRNVVFLDNGLINGSHTYNSLQLTAGKTYTIASRSTQRINTAFYPSGNPCNRTIIRTSTSGTRANIHVVTGNVNYDYVSIQDIRAVRAFLLERHSVNAGNNNNMNFINPNLTAPIIGLGADVSAVVNPSNPYTLTTGGFYPNPTTTFLWDDGSTGPTKAITAYGTYSVKVTYADGCSVSDEILVSPKVNIWVGTFDTDWNKPNNWRNNTVPGNDEDVVFATVINHTHEAVNDLHINGDRRVNNLLNESQRTLVVTPLHHLHVADRLLIVGATPENRLIIKANATGGGSLTFQQPNRNAAVKATVEMYSKARTLSSGDFPRVWQYFGIPVQSVTVSPTFDGSTVRQWVESNQEYYKWEERTGAHQMLPLQGYEITHPAPRTISIQGTLVTSDQIRTLVTSPVDYGGQHILSNPFMGAVNIPYIGFGSNTDATIYLYNTGSRTDWLNFGGSTITGNNPGQYLAIPKLNAGIAGLPSQIPPMQGFLVRAQNGVTGTITLPYSSVVKSTSPMRTPRTTNVTENGETGVANLHASPFYVRVDVADATSIDRVWLFEHPETSRDFDNGHDGAKIFSSEPGLQFYVSEQGRKYQVNTNAGIDGTELVLIAGNNAAPYTVSFDFQNTANRYNRIMLRDLKTNTITDVLAGEDYRFTLLAGETERRFRIEADLNRDALLTALHAFTKDNHQVLTISNTTGIGKADVRVFDISGQLIYQQTVWGEESALDVRLPAGIYIVRMDVGEVFNTEKVTVK